MGCPSLTSNKIGCSIEYLKTLVLSQYLTFEGGLAKVTRVSSYEVTVTLKLLTWPAHNIYSKLVYIYICSYY